MERLIVSKQQGNVNKNTNDNTKTISDEEKSKVMKAFSMALATMANPMAKTTARAEAKKAVEAINAKYNIKKIIRVI